MPRGGLAVFGAVLAVLSGAAWYLVPRWALLWVFFDIVSTIALKCSILKKYIFVLNIR
jgi:prolipoprotein diacylglyceryltransferase